MDNKLYITNCKWGEVTVNSVLKFKDVILCSDGKHIQEWDWNIFGTRHPGINIREFEYISSHPNVTDIIISKGVENALKFNDIEVLSNQFPHVTIWHLQTNEAVYLYNDLVRRGNIVFAYIHSTC